MKVGIPSIVVLLVVGFLAGLPSWGLDPDELLGPALFPFVSLAVAVILFEGGLTLRIDEMRGSGRRAVRNLLSIGVAVTWLSASLLAWLLLDVSTGLAILIGAILVVSGPTVVGPLLAFMGLGGRTASTLRWEGILIDPVGAILAVLVLHGLQAGDGMTQGDGVGGFLFSIGWGAAVGVASGALLVGTLRYGGLPRSLETVLTLAFVLGTFAAAGALRDDAGYVSVVVMGAILANQRVVSVSHIREFKETVGLLLTGVLFIILSARIAPDDLVDAGLASLALVAVLILVVRPLVAFLSTLGTDLHWRERLFIGAMAPRGIVAASTASVAAISLDGTGVRGLDQLVPVVFIVIVCTVTVYGLVSPALARVLGIERGGATQDPEQLAGLLEEGQDPRGAAPEAGRA